MFSLSPEQEIYVNQRGKVVLNAGPGSGKTQTIAHKLHELIENGTESRPHGIACLSFTNVAKDEIQAKYLELSGKKIHFPHTISTIDSFINMFLTLPFSYLINIPFRPQILESPKELDNRYISDLYSGGKLIHKNKAGKALKFSRKYRPSEVFKDLSGNYTVKGGVESSDVELAVFESYATAIKKWQINVGILTNHDSTNVALKLLNDYPDRIGKCLIERFNYFILDEAQDTSEIQHAIFDRLIEIGLANIDLVGDPYQTLYEWRDATPKLFRAKYDSADWTGLNLADNWRSHQPVIECFSRLRLNTDPAILCKKIVSKPLPVHVLKFPSNDESTAVMKYQSLCSDFSDNQVVVRSNELAKKLNGIPNNSNNYWRDDGALQIVNCIRFFQEKQIKKAVDGLRQIIANIENPRLKPHEILELLRISKANYLKNGKLLGMLSELSDFDITLGEWTDKLVKEMSDILPDTISFGCEIKDWVQVGSSRVKKKDFVVRSMNEQLSANLNTFRFPITTIHQAKGKTLDSILLIFKKNSLSVNSYVTPKGDLTETQTMLYVAMSRPRYLLAIGLEDSHGDTEIKKTFGSDCVIL